MTFDERLQRAVDTLGDKFREQFRDELTRELQSVLEDWQAQIPPPPPQPVVDTTAIARLADAVRAIDAATSLSDILQTLATSAANESARAGVFLIRDDVVRSYRICGFPARYDGAPIELPLSDAGVIRDAIDQRGPVTSASNLFDPSTSSGSPRGESKDDDLPPGVDAVALPIVLAGSVIGALYVEGADGPTMEILTRFASRALEAQTAIKTARSIAGAGA